MPFIDTRPYYLALFLCVLSSGAWAAKEAPPSVLQEPVFGLKLPLASAKLKPFPDEMRAQCKQLADNESWKGHLWIYAKAEDEFGTYFVVGGYYERSKAVFSGPRFHLDTSGAVVRLAGKECTAFGGARDVFDARYFAEIPQVTLQRLADDLIIQLMNSFDEMNRFKDAIRRQQPDLDNLPGELRVALREAFRKR
jgi:hypothetical protein